MLTGLLKMITDHKTTKRGYVELKGTVFETPMSFKAMKKSESPRKKAKKAEKINQKRSDGFTSDSDWDKVLFMIMRKKNPTAAHPVLMRFPDHASIPSSPFLYTEALAAQQNAETTARSSPLSTREGSEEGDSTSKESNRCQSSIMVIA